MALFSDIFHALINEFIIINSPFTIMVKNYTNFVKYLTEVF